MHLRCFFMSSEDAANHALLNFAKENPEHNLDSLLSQYHFIITKYLTEM